MADNGLRNCPFCGSSVVTVVSMTGKHGDFLFAQCQACRAQTRTVGAPYDNEQYLAAYATAMHLWNSRTESEGD